MLQSKDLKLPPSEAGQAKFFEEAFKASPARLFWEQAYGEAKMFNKSGPFANHEALKNVKKIAIISFDSSLFASKEAGMGGSGSLLRLATSAMTEKKQKEGIQPADLIQFNDIIFDELRNKLTEQGFEVLPPESVTANEAYGKIEGEAKDASLNSSWSFSKGIKATASAKEMKSLPALNFIKPKMIVLKDTVEERSKILQELAKSLGVDAVVIVSNNLYMKIGGMSGKYDLLYSNKEKGPDGIIVDVFSAAAPALIWSASLSDALEVPTKAEQEGAGHVFGVTKYEFGSKAMPDFIAAYQTIADVLAKKIKADAAQ